MLGDTVKIRAMLLALALLLGVAPIEATTIAYTFSGQLTRDDMYGQTADTLGLDGASFVITVQIDDGAVPESF